MSSVPPLLEPAAPFPTAASDQELTLAITRWLSRRYKQLGARARAGSPDAIVFGETMAALRTGAGIGRLELSHRARLNPLYLALLEMGVWGPDELPAIAIAKLAVGLGRSLAELPVLPYTPGAEPPDATEAEAAGVRIRLGLATLAPWVEAMLAEAGGPPASVWLPDLTVPVADTHVVVVAGQFGNLSAPALPSDEYQWRLVREASPAATWWVHARVTRDGSPAAGVELELGMGAQRRMAVTDAMGELHFDDLDPTDIEPLRLTGVR